MKPSKDILNGNRIKSGWQGFQKNINRACLYFMKKFFNFLPHLFNRV